MRSKLDWIYEGKRRKALKRIYSGDPSNPDNARRVVREELYGQPATTKGTPGVWPLQLWYHQLRARLRNRRKRNH